jgi:hypothetical protein
MAKFGRRSTILDMMLLVAGAAVGLWLVIGFIRQQPVMESKWLIVLIFVLGGMSLIGPPLLLWERRRRRARLQPGELLWFCQGTAAWLLWPPIIVHRVQGKDGNRVVESACYFYGTPLMALFITIALLAGGWIRRPGRRRRLARSWTETFGLLLGLLWACTGFYLLVQIYRNDLFE